MFFNPWITSYVAGRLQLQCVGINFLQIYYYVESEMVGEQYLRMCRLFNNDNCVPGTCRFVKSDVNAVQKLKVIVLYFLVMVV